ncbi:MAG: cysteine synthase A [Candidatus Omnitrophica bacterium]|nr:cysteine synthase A [Candidatus Omnitrophota bacterium]MBD3269187.1 cysteine synthase A [Candidatus Omnitrophota bacterium]
MVNIADNITQLVGKTPLLRLSRMSSGLNTDIVAKLEFFNPSSSIKDRIALAMIEEAEKKGLLSSGSVVIEPTSGNTGIGLALVCAEKGYRLILTMPESMSVERRKLLSLLGAEVVLTPADGGMKGAVKKAEELIAGYDNSFMPQQFKNPANPAIHRKTTAQEIWTDTDGKIDVFIAGIGTGGTITGVGEFLKEKNPHIKIIGVEPRESAVLSGRTPGPHNIQGIGAGFIPEVLRRDLLDEVICVEYKEALSAVDSLAKKEGVLVGPSSGAAMQAALKVAACKKNKGKMIVTVFPDSGERYLSL